MPGKWGILPKTSNSGFIRTCGIPSFDGLSLIIQFSHMFPREKKLPTHAFWGYKSSVFRHIIEIQVKLPSGKQPHSYGKIHHAINGKIHELNHHFQ